jgi:hypothetical protein
MVLALRARGIYIAYEWELLVDWAIGIFGVMVS